jgi:hypothetical protein
MPDTPSLPATRTYFARRWRGEVALGLLFWRDMLAVGTLVNLFASFAALVMVAQGVAGHLAVAVHLAPLPYNLFLLAAVWRFRPRNRPAALAAVVWLVVVTLL